MSAQRLAFANGISLSLAVAGERFLGIGAVEFGGTPLRSDKLPWTVYSESEHGHCFADFTLVGVETDGDRRTIVFTSAGSWLPRLQGADAMGDARVVTRRAVPPHATFRWTLRPISEVIAGETWHGLAMTVAVSAPGQPLHWLIEDGTWEIGGAAAGCTLIQRDVSAIDLEQSVLANSAFSTIEKFFTDGWGGAYPMDMLPRAAGASVLDFQAKGDLALCLFAEQPGLTRARLEKFADEDLIHYTDRPFVALAESIRLPERKLLVRRHARPLERHEWRNLWLDCFDEVRRRILGHYGYRLEVPLPTIWAHLWDEELKVLGPAWTQPLRAALPDYKRLGYSQLFTHGVWNSITSDPQAGSEDGNICAPYDFTYAEQFGGAAGMRTLADAGKAAGLQVVQWFSFHISKYAPVWKQHPEWLLHEANGDPWDANYGILWAGRMRSPYRDYFIDQVKAVKAATGIDGLFWDSYQNLGVTGVDWGAPDKAPQADEIWRFQAELQSQGFTSQRPEIVTIFGVSTVAMFGFAGDRFRRRLWADTVRNDDAFAMIDCAPAFFTDGDAFTRDRLDPARYFWLAGHRVLPAVPARPWPALPVRQAATPRLPGGELADEYARTNLLYLAALPHMRRLRLVAGGGHTVWLDDAGQPAVVWAFRDGRFAYRGQVTDLVGGGSSPSASDFALAANHVYVLGDRAVAQPNLAPPTTAVR